jgi:hypothetical protein
MGDQHPGGRQLGPAGDAGQLELAGLRLGCGSELAVVGARRSSSASVRLGSPSQWVSSTTQPPRCRARGWVASSCWLGPSEKMATSVGVTRSSTRLPGRTRRQGTE